MPYLKWHKKSDAAWIIASLRLICSTAVLPNKPSPTSFRMGRAFLRYTCGKLCAWHADGKHGAGDLVFTTASLMLMLLLARTLFAAGCWHPEPIGEHRALLSQPSVVPEARLYARKRAGCWRSRLVPRLCLGPPSGLHATSSQHMFDCRGLLLQHPVQRLPMQTVWRCCCLWSNNWLGTLRLRSGPPLPSSYQG